MRPPAELPCDILAAGTEPARSLEKPGALPTLAAFLEGWREVGFHGERRELRSPSQTWFHVKPAVEKSASLPVDHPVETVHIAGSRPKPRRGSPGLRAPRRPAPGQVETGRPANERPLVPAIPDRASPPARLHPGHPAPGRDRATPGPSLPWGRRPAPRPASSGTPISSRCVLPSPLHSSPTRDWHRTPTGASSTPAPRSSDGRRAPRRATESAPRRTRSGEVPLVPG